MGTKNVPHLRSCRKKFANHFQELMLFDFVRNMFKYLNLVALTQRVPTEAIGGNFRKIQGEPRKVTQIQVHVTFLNKVIQMINWYH